VGGGGAGPSPPKGGRPSKDTAGAIVAVAEKEAAAVVVVEEEVSTRQLVTQPYPWGGAVSSGGGCRAPWAVHQCGGRSGWLSGSAADGIHCPSALRDQRSCSYASSSSSLAAGRREEEEEE
jgi:hypothetical protein